MTLMNAVLQIMFGTMLIPLAFVVVGPTGNYFAVLAVAMAGISIILNGIRDLKEAR